MNSIGKTSIIDAPGDKTYPRDEDILIVGDRYISPRVARTFRKTMNTTAAVLMVGSYHQANTFGHLLDEDPNFSLSKDDSKPYYRQQAGGKKRSKQW